MAARANVVHGGKVGDPPQMRDAAGMHDGCANVIDQLFLNQGFAIPDRIEYLAHRQRRDGVLADQAEVCAK